MKPTIKVVFRILQKECIALFPLEPYSHRIDLCMSYAHNGQHGGSSVWMSRWSRLAKPSEYRALAKELRRIGYRLQIIKRIPNNAWAIRKSKLPTK